MQSPPKIHEKCGAFGLVELLAAMLIATALVLLSAWTLKQVIQASLSSGCIANLRVLHLALNNYALDNNNCYPAGYVGGVTWLTKINDYLPENAGKKKRPGVTYCPATKINAKDIYKRDPAQWRTDYNINGNVASAATAFANNRAKISGSFVLLYDGGGGAPISANDAKERARHNGRINVIFVDSHVESISSFEDYTNVWKR